jgi:hypothetical protein
VNIPGSQTLSVAQITWLQTIRREISEGGSYLGVICRQLLRRSEEDHEKLSKGIQSPSRNSDPGPLRNEAFTSMTSDPEFPSSVLVADIHVGSHASHSGGTVSPYKSSHGESMVRSSVCGPKMPRHFARLLQGSPRQRV